MVQQLELFGIRDYEPHESRFGTIARNDSITTSNTDDCVVIESKITPQQPVIESSGTVNNYQAGGKARGQNEYYRYSWRDGKRVRHKHIPGGNIDSITAKKRAALVQCEIDAGKSPDQILEFIKSFGRTTR